MIIKRLVLTLAATVFLLPLASTADDKKPEHVFKMATSWGGGPIMRVGPKAFAEEVEKLSDGRIQIKVFDAGVLGDPLDVADTVKNGVADMGHTWMGYDYGKDKTTVLFGGFSGSPLPLATAAWFYEGNGEKLQREYRQEKAGVVSIPLALRSTEVFLHSNKPVQTLDDLQGMRIRTVGPWVDILDDIGADPITTTHGDVFTMLTQGTIDATEVGSAWENAELGYHEVAKYVILPGVHQPVAPFELMINQKVWDSLSESDQEMMTKVAKLITLDSWLQFETNDADAVQKFIDNGNEIIQLDREVQQKVRDLSIDWANSQEDNEWFKKVWMDQQEFLENWKKAEPTRAVLPLTSASEN